MNRFRVSLYCLAASAGLLLQAGCANVEPPMRPEQNAVAAKEAKKDKRIHVTGSRLPVTKEIELVGIKTVDQENIREEKMFQSNPGFTR